jgi:hypothetical protein
MYLDLENLDLENTFLQFLDLQNLDLQNLDLQNLDLQNLDLQNLDLENLDLQNLDLQNSSNRNLDLQNLDLQNLDLQNTAPGDDYTEISWTADSATNTTTGVDIKPIFSPTLAAALTDSLEQGGDFKVLLTVRQPYMNSTVVTNDDNVQYCAPQVVVENQILYAAILDKNQIDSLFNDPDPNNPFTPSFVAGSGQSTIITARFINPTLSQDALNANTGMAVYAHPGVVDCDAEIGGAEVEDACEIDAPDSELPVVTAPADITGVEASAPLTPIADIGLASATDNIGVVNLTNDSPGSFPVGTTTVTWTATDAAGNEGTATQLVTVTDTTDPVITLTGADPQTIEGGTPYVELGATATDTVGGNLTADIVTDASAVITSVLGSYAVTYTVSDGFNSVTETRTVNVVDTTDPVITITGANPQTIEGATPYVELGATATDAVGGDLTGAINIDASAVNTSILGSYAVTYTVSDGFNSVTETRTVNVVDTTPPVIMLVGDNPLPFEATNLGYVDPGATAFDSVALDLTFVILTDTSDVNAAVEGTYIVNYSVFDGFNTGVGELLGVRRIQHRGRNADRKCRRYDGSGHQY